MLSAHLADKLDHTMRMEVHKYTESPGDAYLQCAAREKKATAGLGVEV